MLKLERVESAILELEKKEAITVEDVLGFFIDLRKDIRDACNYEVRELPIQDSQETANKLVACGRIFTSIGNEIINSLSSQKNEKLNRMMAKIDKQTDEFQNIKIDDNDTLPEQIDYFLQLNEKLEATMDDLESKQEMNHQNLVRLVKEHLQV